MLAAGRRQCAIDVGVYDASSPGCSAGSQQHRQRTARSQLRRQLRHLLPGRQEVPAHSASTRPALLLRVHHGDRRRHLRTSVILPLLRTTVSPCFQVAIEQLSHRTQHTSSVSVSAMPLQHFSYRISTLAAGDEVTAPAGVESAGGPTPAARDPSGCPGGGGGSQLAAPGGATAETLIRSTGADAAVHNCHKPGASSSCVDDGNHVIVVVVSATDAPPAATTAASSPTTPSADLEWPWMTLGISPHTAGTMRTNAVRWRRADRIAGWHRPPR